MSLASLSNELNFDLNSDQEIVEIREYFDNLKNFYDKIIIQPNVGELITNCLGNNVFYGLEVLRRNTENYARANFMTSKYQLNLSAKRIKQTLRKSFDKIRSENYGFIRPEEKYEIFRGVEPEVQKKLLEFYFQELNAYGFDEQVREQMVSDRKKLFNKYLDIFGSYFREEVLLLLPTARLQYFEYFDKFATFGELKHIEVIHTKTELEILNAIRTTQIRLATATTIFRPREFDVRALIKKFCRKITKTYLQSLYLGMRGNKNNPIGTKFYTRVDLERFENEYLRDLETVKQVSGDLTNVTEELEEIYGEGSEETNRQLELLKEQIKSWERDVSEIDNFNDLSQEEQDIRLFLSKNKLSKKLTDDYLLHILKKRSMKAIRRGNIIHDLLPKLLGIPMYVKLRDMIDQPHKFDIWKSGWLIATEVSFYYDNKYNVADIVILRIEEIYDEEGMDVLIPRVYFVGDMKTMTLMEYTTVFQVRPNRNERRDDKRMEKLLSNPPENKIAVRLVGRQRKPDSELSINENTKSVLQGRNLDQLEKYSSRIIVKINKWNLNNNEYNQVAEDVLKQKEDDVILGIFKIDSYARSNGQWEKMAIDFWKILSSYLMHVSDKSNWNDYRSYYSVEIDNFPNIQLHVRDTLPRSMKHIEDTEIFQLDIKPFQHSTYPLKNKETCDFQVEIHYPVPGLHYASSKLVADISSLQYILEIETDSKDELLLLDIINDFKPRELMFQRILGLDHQLWNKAVVDKLKKIETLSFDCHPFEMKEISQKIVKLLKQMSNKKYDTVIIWGLQRIIEEIIPANRDDIMIELKEIILKILKNWNISGQHRIKRVILIEKPVEDVTMNPYFRKKTLLPYKPVDLEEIPLFQKYLIKISYNFPRSPFSIRSKYTKRDEERIIDHFIADKDRVYNKDERTIYYCSRFIGETVSYKEPRKFARQLLKNRTLLPIIPTSIKAHQYNFVHGLVRLDTFNEKYLSHHFDTFVTKQLDFDGFTKENNSTILPKELSDDQFSEEMKAINHFLPWRFASTDLLCENIYRLKIKITDVENQKRQNLIKIKFNPLIKPSKRYPNSVSIDNIKGFRQFNYYNTDHRQQIRLKIRFDAPPLSMYENSKRNHELLLLLLLLSGFEDNENDAIEDLNSEYSEMKIEKIHTKQIESEYNLMTQIYRFITSDHLKFKQLFQLNLNPKFGSVIDKQVKLFESYNFSSYVNEPISKKRLVIGSLHQELIRLREFSKLQKSNTSNILVKVKHQIASSMINQIAPSRTLKFNTVIYQNYVGTWLLFLVDLLLDGLSIINNQIVKEICQPEISWIAHQLEMDKKSKHQQNKIPYRLIVDEIFSSLIKRYYRIFYNYKFTNRFNELLIRQLQPLLICEYQQAAIISVSDDLHEQIVIGNNYNRDVEKNDGGDNEIMLESTDYIHYFIDQSLNDLFNEPSDIVLEYNKSGFDEINIHSSHEHTLYYVAAFSKQKVLYKIQKKKLVSIGTIVVNQEYRKIFINSLLFISKLSFSDNKLKPINHEMIKLPEQIKIHQPDVALIIDFDQYYQGNEHGCFKLNLKFTNLEIDKNKIPQHSKIIDEDDNITLTYSFSLLQDLFDLLLELRNASVTIEGIGCLQIQFDPFNPHILVNIEKFQDFVNYKLLNDLVFGIQNSIYYYDKQMKRQNKYGNATTVLSALPQTIDEMIDIITEEYEIIEVNLEIGFDDSRAINIERETATIKSEDDMIQEQPFAYYLEIDDEEFIDLLGEIMNKKIQNGRNYISTRQMRYIYYLRTLTSPDEDKIYIINFKGAEDALLQLQEDDALIEIISPKNSDISNTRSVGSYTAEREYEIVSWNISTPDDDIISYEIKLTQIGFKTQKTFKVEFENYEKMMKSINENMRRKGIPDLGLPESKIKRDKRYYEMINEFEDF